MNKWLVSITRRLIIVAALCMTSLSAQETIQVGFEEFPIGATPPFVQPNGHNAFSRVANQPSFTLGAVPYEGSNYLLNSKSILLASPNSEPIISFSLRFFMPGPPNEPSAAFGAGNTRGNPAEMGTWQLIKGTFSTPVAQFVLFAVYNEGETVSAAFGIDAVQLVTIPEPCFGLILGLGITISAFGRLITLRHIPWR